MGGPHVMTREQKQMARRLKAKGLSLKAIARDLSCSLGLGTTSVYFQREGTGRPGRWSPAPGRQAGAPAPRSTGEHLAREAVVTQGDSRALASGVSRRSDDAGEPRNH